MELTIIICTAAIGLYMAWNIGANDVANSMADAVGSRSISVKQAVVLAGICEFAGAVLVGSSVTNTVRKGIVDPSLLATMPGIDASAAATIMVIGMTAALLSAALFLNFSSLWGIPVSTTHSIVGAVAGFGIVAAGWSAVNWGKMGQIVASWFISPVAGGLLAFFIFNLISKYILGQEKPTRAAIRYTPLLVFVLTAVVTLATVYKGLKHVTGDLPWLTDAVTLYIGLGFSAIMASLSILWVKNKLRNKDHLPISAQLEQVEQLYVPLVVISSCAVAFAHGANDVANAIGPFAAIVHILQTGTIEMKVGVPFWILCMGGIGIVLGLATYGYRVMETVGTKITEITPSRGVAADLAATATVLVCTRLALPVSTTHTLVGAILGIGLARGLGGVNRKVVTSIFGSWIITVPAAALMSMILFLIGKFFFFDLIREIIIK
ncbi:MAG: inorganic phosphate transporter [Desulfobulbaceae bacterium]|uniref:Phosphate transporter n=1 Tax=Candidatus Desulfatifera sulfidica TaxID=2841691 RepID=A0A8J6N8K7_9BACT|nr:inorganic phosphate transporter [Candidatus Desulfatifera sulfidica]